MKLAGLGIGRSHFIAIDIKQLSDDLGRVNQLDSLKLDFGRPF
jgi:hypothetical protein